MIATPSTLVYLCSGINFDSDYKNTLYFEDAEEQFEFFENKIEYSFEDFTYQRKNRNVLNLPISVSNIINCSYLFFKNSAHENKYYYCFITDFEYINENTTAVYYEVDYIQTYLFDFELLTSFIDRCHSATDVAGDNIIEENFNLGEFYNNTTEDITDLNDYYILLLSTIKIVNSSGLVVTQLLPPDLKIRNKLFDGLELTVINPQTSHLSDISNALHLGVDYIVNMWLYPKDLIQVNQWQFPVGSTDGVASTEFQLLSNIYTLPTRNTSLNGYTPKNNKLLTHPFNFMQISNNNGSSLDLKYEKFDLTSPHTSRSVRVLPTTTGEAKCLLTPICYNGVPYIASEEGSNNEKDFEMGLLSAPYPTVSYVGDSYQIYLAQNRNTIINNVDTIHRNADLANLNADTDYKLEQTKNLISLVTGNIVGAALNSGMSDLKYAKEKAQLANNELNQISSMVASLEDARTMPNSAHGVQSTGIALQHGKQLFTIYQKSVDAQHAQMIDNYFTMFGYKQNKLMIPPIHNRSHYTFVKTVGCNLSGNIPDSAKQMIQSIFDKGLTFWVDNDEIGDYSVTNSTI